MDIPEKKIEWSSAITRLTVHFTYGLMFDLVIYKHIYILHQMSLLRPGVKQLIFYFTCLFIIICAVHVMI